MGAFVPTYAPKSPNAGISLNGNFDRKSPVNGIK